MNVLLAALVMRLLDPEIPTPRYEPPLSESVHLLLAGPSEVTVGQPITLTLELHNTSTGQTLGYFDLGPLAGKVSLHYRCGADEFRRLSNFDRRGEVLRQAAQALVVLSPGERLTKEVVIGEDVATHRPLLDRAGFCDFSARYVDAPHAGALLESNTASVRVSAVPSSDESALDAYRLGLAAFPEYVRGFSEVDPDLIARAGDFLTRFQGSTYWPHVLRGVERALVDRVQGDVASGAERELLRRIREEWRDRTPPVLAILATPSELWPPNGKLLPVSITMSVDDDVDPSPRVHLTSISCDDGCDVAKDVQEASAGSADSEFLLRSRRSGAGKSRTYTIIYTAVDAVGNSTTARTTVVVPHDKGR